MSFKGKLYSYKQYVAIAVAAVVLATIFAPFQRASAFTVDLSLPNASTSAVPTSAVGSTFKTTINVSAGELISISSVELILDNNQAGIKRAVFDTNGQRVDGVPTLVRGNLDITIPSTTGGYYGYGYGYITPYAGFTPNYYYSITGSYGNIAGNTGGYTNYVSGANTVTGFIGPGEITIEGKLNTAQMSTGTHTLDIIVHTGAGGNNVDNILAPQLTFTTVGNSSIASASVSTGSNQEVQTTVPGSGKVKVKFANVLAGGNVIIDPATYSAFFSSYTGIFDSLTSVPKLKLGSDVYNVIGQMFDIDASQLTTSGSITVTLPIDRSSIPGGVSLSNLVVLHYNTSTNTWEKATNITLNSDNTITGTITSLSPVAVGFASGTTTPSTPGSSPGGGGGGGGIGAVDLTGTYPDSFFVNNPLAKVQVASLGVVNAQNHQVFAARSGQQVSISSAFKNYQQGDQTYAFIVQVLDRDGQTTDLSWQTGTLKGGQSTTLSSSWTAGEPGAYKIQVFIWNSVTKSPVALSQGSSSSFSVS